MLKEFFDSERIFIEKEKLTYSEFYKLCLENAHSISNKGQLVSLVVDNQLSDLINIFSLWILDKSIVFHSNNTPKSDIEKFNKQLNAKPLEKENTHFNNTISELSNLDSMACYIFTSGSTSGQRPIGLSYNNLLCAAESFNNFFKVQEQHYMPINLPLYHVGGLMIAIRSLVKNCSTDILSPGDLTKENFSRTPDFLSVVPTQMDRVLASTDFSFFRSTNFILGGAKAPNGLLEEISKRKLLAASTYGMTETTAMCLSTGLTSEFSILKTVGKPLPGTSITLDEQGVAQIHSDSVASQFKGSFVTSDKLQINSDENYNVLGRVDSVFISGGENVNPSEIEETLYENGIKNSYLVSIEDKKFQHIGVLFFDPIYNIDEVKEICKKVLHKHKVPKHFYPLPIQKTGIKTKRSLLRKQAQAFKEIHNIGSNIPTMINGDPDKEWLLFIHGFMGKKEDWSEVFNEISSEFFLIAIDCPGHGENEIRDKISKADFFKDLNYLINNLPKSVHLIGYSQGARLSLGTVLAGAKVKSLILESGSVGIVDEQERENRYLADLKMFNLVSTKEELLKFLEYWYSNSLFGNISKHSNYKNMILSKINHQPIQWKKSLEAFSVGAQENYRPKLQKIDVPKIIICGQRDHKYLAQAKELEVQFDFALECIKDVSHNTHFESPIDFCNILKRHILSI